ncbi:MAG: LysR family transcriptional regulator [Myxococcota bacterium]
MTDLDWNDIRVFLVLFRQRTVRAAATELRMSHSTVSRHLTALEDALGGALFTRSRDGLVATALAEQILARAQTVEDEMLSLQRDASSLETVLTGEVRIAVSPGLTQYLIMPCLARFADDNPGIELVIASSNDMVDLMRGACDVAIRTQARPDENLVGRRLPPIIDYVWASPAYIAKHTFEGNQTSASWIAFARGKAGRAWVENTPFPTANVRHVMPDPLDHVHAAAAGMGMTTVPQFLADRVGGLVRVPGTGPVTTRPLWALTHPDLRTSVRIRAFVKFLADAMVEYAPVMAGKTSR